MGGGVAEQFQGGYVDTLIKNVSTQKPFWTFFISLILST